MFEQIRKYLKEFLHEEPKNQVIVVLVFVIGFMLYGKYEEKKIIRQHQYERFISDSIRVTRHDSFIRSLQGEKDSCNIQRIKDFKALYERTQKIADDKFLETDKEYQKRQSR